MEEEHGADEAWCTCGGSHFTTGQQMAEEERWILEENNAALTDEVILTSTLPLNMKGHYISTLFY